MMCLVAIFVPLCLVTTDEVACRLICMHDKHFQQSMDPPGILVNHARHRLNKDKVFCLSPFGLGLAVPPRVSPLILHTRAESGAYSRDFSRFPRRRRASPEFIESRNCVPMAFTGERPPAQHRRRACCSSNKCRAAF